MKDANSIENADIKMFSIDRFRSVGEGNIVLYSFILVFWAAIVVASWEEAEGDNPDGEFVGDDDVGRAYVRV